MTEEVQPLVVGEGRKMMAVASILHISLDSL